MGKRKSKVLKTNIKKKDFLEELKKKQKEYMLIIKEKYDKAEKLDNEEIKKKIGSELYLSKLRLNQIWVYFNKVHYLLEGKSIEEVEKDFPPFDFKTMSELSKNRKEGVKNG